MGPVPGAGRGATSNTTIERLNKLQKRAARIILRANLMTPSSEMFQQLGWTSVRSRIKYNKARGPRL